MIDTHGLFPCHREWQTAPRIVFNGEAVGEKELSKEVSVVLGAGGGIGRACVRMFVERGRHVFGADKDPEALGAAVADVAGGVTAQVVDATQPMAVQALFRTASQAGALRDLVYAPGIAITTAIERTNWSDYRRLMAVNLDGAFYACAAFVSAVSASSGHGSIVLISSTAGLRGESGATAYCASKFGLIGLAESLAAELAGKHIRVNAVCPGNVDTPMLEEIVQQIAEYEGVGAASVRDRLTHDGSACRLVRPEEVAAACWYLCSGEAAAITGTALRIDGGQMVG